LFTCVPNDPFNEYPAIPAPSACSFD